MNEADRTARYEAQNKGRPETPAQRRRRLKKRGHQMRQANLRRTRVVDLQLPSNLVFKAYKVPDHTFGKGD